jgi:hypothetical protein
MRDRCAVSSDGWAGGSSPYLPSMYLEMADLFDPFLSPSPSIAARIICPNKHAAPSAHGNLTPSHFSTAKTKKTIFCPKDTIFSDKKPQETRINNAHIPNPAPNNKSSPRTTARRKKQQKGKGKKRRAQEADDDGRRVVTSG